MRKNTAIAVSLLALVDTTGLLSAGVAKGKLIKQASITRSEAEHIALSQVQDGRIMTVELEKEHGRLLWSLDIARPNTRNITELQVDAKSGQIVSTKIESPKDEKKETAGEKTEARRRQ
jgi:uncharacterized membrane protein YkoI